MAIMVNTRRWALSLVIFGVVLIVSSDDTSLVLKSVGVASYATGVIMLMQRPARAGAAADIFIESRPAGHVDATRPAHTGARLSGRRALRRDRRV